MQPFFTVQTWRHHGKHAPPQVEKASHEKGKPRQAPTGGQVGRNLLIRGGRVVDPASGFDDLSDLLVRNGVVVARGRDLPTSPEDEIVDATDQVVAPGFIDLHTHLRFPGYPDKETVASGTEAAAAGGFTTVCAMANTNPVVDSVETVRQVQAEVQRSSRLRVYQLAAVTRGLAGREMTDFSALAKAGAIAFSDDGKPVWDAEIMRRALVQANRLGKSVSVHEEEPGIVGPGVANAGETARKLGLSEWPCTGEAAMVARDIAILQETGGHLHIAHVSCEETVALVRRAKSRGLHVTAEVTPHHLCLTDALLAGEPSRGLPPAHPCTKVNPPLRSVLDVEALIEALADGTIDAIATDHAPHTAQDKAKPFASAAFGFTGIEVALPLMLDLVRAAHVDLQTMVERLTGGPARVFRLPGGTLAPGAPADICVFDPEIPWQVTEDNLRSRGKNTPLLGAHMRGRVTRTIVAGQILRLATPNEPPYNDRNI